MLKTSAVIPAIALALCATALAAAPKKPNERAKFQKQLAERNEAVRAADTKLLHLDPDGAITGYRKMMALSDLPAKAADSSKVRAAMGLARAYAEKADFEHVRQWIDYYKHHIWMRGGDNQPAFSVQFMILGKVWEAADSYHPKERLEAIVGGKFVPLKNPLDPTSEPRQKKAAAREAALLLGEHLKRQGDVPGARAAFKKAVGDGKSGEWAAKMAAAHLKSLDQPTAVKASARK